MNEVLVIHVQDVEALNKAVSKGYEINCATAGYIVLTLPKVKIAEAQTIPVL